MKHGQAKKCLAFILASIMCLSALVIAPPAAQAAGDSDTLSGWTLEEGFSVTSIWVYEGSYALAHTGAQSQAVSREIELEEDVTYYVSAHVRNSTAEDKVTLSIGGYDLESAASGRWEELSVKIVGGGTKEQLVITATGNTTIDGVSVRPFKEGEELIGNGSFTDKADPWHSLSGLYYESGEVEGHTGVIGNSITGGVATGWHPGIGVEPNSYCLYSADFYLEDENGPWLYADMNDAEGEVQIRATKSGEWQNVAGLWSSGSSTTTSIRLVVESNWNDPTAGTFVGKAYIDNVSFKKVTLYEDLIGDTGFESGGVWKLNSGASIQTGSWKLFGNNSLKLQDTASAVANGGEVIAVEPNSYYYLSGWRIRPGDKDGDASLVLKTADGSQELYSITGSRYHQTMWNPEDGRDNAEKKIGQWEQIFGFWFSGDNTEVTLWAESAGTGTIYFDNVTFNSFENRATLGNIFTDGDMEGFIPDAQDLYPTDSEKARVAEQYAGFLADDLANFPVSFSVGGDAYTGFGTDFTKQSQSTEAVDGGTRTITELAHTSGLVFRVESVLYPDYNAYDWTIYVTNGGAADSPVVSKFNAVDITLEGEAPRLKGSIGDSSAYEPYTIAVDGKVTKKPDGGRGTQGDSSYFNFMYGDKGMLYAVGWPGQWTMSVDNSDQADQTRLTAGQEYLNTYLEPGETIRTPLMAFVHYNGRNLERATNLWRRWMIDCNMHKVTEDSTGAGESKLPEAAIFAATSIQWHEMTRATDENQIEAIQYYLDNDIDLTFWWMDAGWYYMVDSAGNLITVPDWGWTNTGTWVVDDSRFPSKMKAISDFAAQNGIKTLLWFEPERVANAGALRTDGMTVHPDWVLDGYLVDMGREEAVEWTLERILKVMGEGGISMYREDFNCNPLSAWQNADRAKDSGGDRAGITENLYIQGHLGMWDSILEEFPNATIDSCASGGKRNDLETMRRAVPLHKTDYSYGDRTWQQAVATDMTRWIPYIGTKANGESAADNNTTTANRYSLRTAIVGAMVLGYNTEESVPIDWDIVKDVTEEQKVLGDLIYSDYYVLEDWSRRETDWAAWEYYDIEKGEGYVLAFRRSSATGTRTYNLRGLEKETEYKIWFEDANKPVVRTGLDLMQNGVEFNLPSVESSDILHIQKAAAADADRALVSNITQVSVNGQHKGAILTEGGYDRFDVRFNMSLRGTVLGVGDGKVEKDVAEDYKDLVTIDGKTVAELLADDAQAVKMDYDVVNNILNVYVKSGILNPDSGVEVILSEDLASDGMGLLEGRTRFAYSAAGDSWTKSAAETGTPVESVKIYGEKEMLVGESQKLSAVVLPAGADDKGLVWTSSDEKIATVDENGNVKAVGKGTVRITAAAQDGSGVSDSFEIKVAEKNVNPGGPNPPVDPDDPNPPAGPDDPVIPDTGDALGRSLWIVVGVTLAAAGAAAGLFLRRRAQQH